MPRCYSSQVRDKIEPQKVGHEAELTKGAMSMGPIGCVLGLFAQIIHLIVLIITLPIVLICSLFGGKRQ